MGLVAKVDNKTSLALCFPSTTKSFFSEESIIINFLNIFPVILYTFPKYVCAQIEAYNFHKYPEFWAFP